MSDQAIGIFDSGIGGLTVCKAIHDLLPEENIIYFGDTARFPYGTRSPETIIRYSEEITRYLLSRNVKLIVIACNTSSAAALDSIRASIDIPIIGVIEAGARAAHNRSSGAPIGVVATRATVASESYIRAIRSLDENAVVLQQQGTLFVTLTEEGMTDNEIARLTAREYIEPMYRGGIKTLILGCTHFPLLKKAIGDVYPDLDLVDTGIEIAREVEAILEEKNLAVTAETRKMGTVELYASDITDTMKDLKKTFFGSNGTEISKLIIKG